MAALFSKPKTPKVRPVDPPAPPPERSDAEIAAMGDEQRRIFSRSGRSALTMLTGGTGAASGVSASRYLGAAART